MSATWYSDSKYQREITHKAANIYENYTNEPFALRLNIDGLGDAARADGADIVFTNAAGTLLKRAIISFDRATPDGQAWVQLPAGDAAAGGTAVYMQWGGESVNVANDADVFPTEYDLVSLIDGTAGDYSQNANDGALVGSAETTPTSAAGQIGNGLDFDDTNNQYVDYGDEDYYSFGDGSEDSAFTIAAWVNLDDYGDKHTVLCKVGTNAEEWHARANYDGSTGSLFYLYDESSGGRIARYDNANALPTGKWTLVVFTCSGSATEAGLNIYENTDVVDNTSASSGAYTAMENLGASLTCGTRPGLDYFDGKMNAVRLYSGEWSANKIKTVYDAESNYSTNGAFTIGSTVEKTSSARRGTLNMGMGMGF